MNQYDPDIHHRRTVRFHEFDYSEQGLYFVTICVHEQRSLFGRIVDGEMQFNLPGKIANKYWTSIGTHFPNTFLHEFVIMPNHIHGIIEITGGGVGARFIAPCNDMQNNNDFSNRDTINQGTVVTNVTKGAINRAPTAAGGFAGTKNPMSDVNLARIIRWYKGRTTFECRKKQLTFAWQRDYYEHIVRNNDDYFRIVEYITNNPAKWHEDRFCNVENTYK